MLRASACEPPCCSLRCSIPGTSAGLWPSSRSVLPHRGSCFRSRRFSITVCCRHPRRGATFTCRSSGAGWSTARRWRSQSGSEHARAVMPSRGALKGAPRGTPPSRGGRLFHALLESVRAAVSGGRALETVRELARFHRIQASPGYDDAAGWIAERLETLGLTVEREDVPGDGKTRCLGSLMPQGWACSRAVATLVSGSRRERLCDY